MPAPEGPRAGEAPEAAVRLTYSPGFAGWLAAQGVSLAFSTYQTNRLFLVGVTAEGRVAAFERLLDRPMGLATSGGGLWLATRNQIWRFEGLDGGDLSDGHDRVYVPSECRFTGEVDAHDLAVDGEGRILFVNTLYSCLATTAADDSFAPVWRPPFVSALVPEDRCHLNGLAMAGGIPRFATAVSRSDVAGGWRERRRDGGVAIDLASGEIVCRGLSMPHSPRIDTEGRLWVIDSGSGDLGSVDGGGFEPLAFLPGYGRGLALVGGHAVVGLSKARERVFAGLALQERLEAKDASARCGLWVIDLASGKLAHWLEIGGVVVELYDVIALPGVRQPMALGLRGDELRRLVLVEHGDGSRRASWTAPRQAAGAVTEPVPDDAERSASPAGPSVELLSGAEAVRRLAGITFPDLARRSATRPLAEPLVAALEGEPPAAAIVGEPQLGGRAAEVISLFVRPERRRRGSARRLLRALEGELRRRSVSEIGAALRTDWPAYPSVVAMLESEGWLPPLRRRMGGRGDERILGAEWLRSARRLPDGWSIGPWSSLSGPERAEVARRLERGEAPAVLSPFQEEGRLERLNSVVLRDGDRVAGWLVTHRMDPKTVQYTALWVEPHPKRGVLGVALLAEAFRRQHAAGVPYGTFLVDVENREMSRFFARRLAPHLASRWEVVWMRKPLG